MFFIPILSYLHSHVYSHAGVGMFTYTELSEIVLLVVRKFSIPGFYSAHIDCPLMTTGNTNATHV